MIPLFSFYRYKAEDTCMDDYWVVVGQGNLLIKEISTVNSMFT